MRDSSSVMPWLRSWSACCGRRRRWWRRAGARPAGHAQAFEGLRAGHLVHEVTVDVEHAGAVVLAIDDVAVPDLLEQGARRGRLGRRRGRLLAERHGAPTSSPPPLAARTVFGLRLFLLELLAARPLDGLLGLLGDQLALGLGVLGDAARLAAQVAQVIELGAAHDALADDLDLPDARAVEREHALDAFAEADLAHRERGVHAGVLAGDAEAFIDLQALAVAFLHLDVHAQRVAGLEARHRPLGLHLVDRRLADRVENVHRIHPFVTSLRSLRSAGGPTDRAAAAA